MKRDIIEIDEALCDGCGLCASACHEGAIGIVDGKAKLLREDYCDGLGNCLPVCPQSAIKMVNKEAPAFVEPKPAGCPGSQAKRLLPKLNLKEKSENVSALQQWPIQIQLVPVQAEYFQSADLLVCADCVAYAHANFHEEFLQGKIVIIGCPKLDPVDYTEKLTEIISGNDIRSLTILRMEVPCCGGLEYAATQALRASGKFIPWQVVTISIQGEKI
ncbi:MAG: 4Fe-4S binding protein [Erysipelotrichaceae bacterium]|nr:4Fe-4S binding protein [Erysipelotrichaceae bacterium]